MDALRQLGTYALIHKIAAGGMAEVWMGRRQAMGGAAKTVAIKLLAAHLAENPVYRRMFVDEARLSMMLSHSNLVQVFDVGEQGGRSYLVMEWVDGLDLSRLIAHMREAGEPLDFAVVGHVVAEVLRGLAYAHELGGDRGAIVHRDISPHNVLLSVSGEVKISDFGVARLSSEETSGVHVRGKLRYMPPEQVRGDSKHPTIDLYAVGALLQEMLDGVRFRAGLERDELFAMVLTGRVPPLRRADVPPELVALRDGLLAPEREDRIPSALAALALLRRWSGLRDASEELATLVRRFVGVAAPRSGLGVEPSDEELQLVDASDEPTSIEGAAKPGSSEVATRTVPQEQSETTPSSFERPLASSPGPSSRRALAVAFIGLLGLGLGLGLGGAWLQGEREGLPSLAHAATTGESMSAVEPDAAPAEPTLTRAASKPDLRPASAPAPTPAPASDAATPRTSTSPAAATSPSPTASAPKPKASVEFAAHQFFFVWIKVGSRTIALEPTASLELPPGRHTVQLRERADQDWAEAGRIRVEGGRRYRVKMQRPAGLALERL